MNSNHTRQIINEIAEEEGLSEKAVYLIVKSQFEGVKKTIEAGVPGKFETYKSVRLNAFGIFKFIPWRFHRFLKEERHIKYLNEKRIRHDKK